MSLINAVTPTEAPQAGVKRSITGRPTGLGTNLPAFRGKPVRADGPIKVPKLSQGNRNNEGTNVAIPYNRVCPLEFLSGWTGRLAPGDVAFILKYPPGFLSKQAGANNGTAGTATMSRVIGLDGVNRLLHGGSNPDGWVAGDNVFVSPVPKDRSSPLRVLQTGADPEDRMGGFNLSLLNSIRLDGVVKSNDEPFSFTSSGSRDAVIFNNVIQGPTIVNNGYLLYDPKANPGLNVRGAGQPQSHGATLLRTVEAYPRGSIEGGYHIGGRDGGGVPGRVGSPWTGKGNYDYVATFTGTYTTYPAQMFDRNPQPMNSLYLGLRAYEMSVEAKKQIQKQDGTGKQFQNEQEAAAATCYFYQIMPFSSRKAWLCQHVQDELEKTRNEALNSGGAVDALVNADIGTWKGKAANAGKEPSKVQLADWRATAIRTEADAQSKVPARAAFIDAALADKLNKINCTLVNHTKGEKKSRFDDDVFDAVRSEDLANMVGAWHLGRVMDVKAMRHTAYDGGPQDTGFALTVDVEIAWRDAFYRVKKIEPSKPDVQGSSKPAMELNSATAFDAALTNTELQTLNMIEYGTNTIGKDGKKTNSGVQQALKDQKAVDVYNSQNPAMRTLFGPLFGRNLAIESMTFDNAWVKLFPVRWPMLHELWFDLLKFATTLDKIKTGATTMPADPKPHEDVEDTDTAKFNPPGPTAENKYTTSAQIHVQVLVTVIQLIFYDTGLKDDAAASNLRTLLRSAGLGADPSKSRKDYIDKLNIVLGKLVPNSIRGKKKKSVMSRYKWFLLLSGFRFPHTEPEKRKNWYMYGPKLYPTLEGLEDGPGADAPLTLENVETHHAAFAAAYPQGDAASRSAEAWSAPAGILSVAAEAANDVQLGVVAPPQPPPPQPSVTAAVAAAAVAAAAEEPTAMELDDDPGAGIGATAAVASPAPAAAAAAAAGRQAAAGARRPSPARARAGAGTRAAAAPTVAAAAAATAQASTAAAASSSSAPAPLSAAPARPRQRQAQSASTVASVFDSIFGANDEQIAQAGAGDPISSPTPSSGSEQGGGATGPKTFRRQR